MRSRSPRIARASLGSFALRIWATCLGFGTAILVARWIGHDNFGVYATVMSWQTLLSVPATLGLGTLLVREVARAAGLGTLPTALANFRLAIPIATLVGVVLGASFVALAYVLLGDSILIPAVVGGAAVPFIAASSVRQGFLQGAGRTVVGQLPELGVRPLVHLVAVVVAWFVLTSVDAVTPLMCFLGACVTSALIGSMTCRSVMRRLASPTQRAASDGAPQLIRASTRLMVLSTMPVLEAQAGVVILSIVSGTTDAGIFAAAGRGAEILAFVPLAVNAALAPRVATLVAGGHHEEVRRLLHVTGFVVTVPVVAGAVCLALFGSTFLALFGPEFRVGHTALVLLCTAQVVSTFAFPVGLYLVMSGNDRLIAKAMLLATLLNFGVAFGLAGELGSTGASIGRLVAASSYALVVLAVGRRQGTLRLSLRAGAHDTLRHFRQSRIGNS